MIDVVRRRRPADRARQDPFADKMIEQRVLEGGRLLGRNKNRNQKDNCQDSN